LGFIPNAIKRGGKLQQLNGIPVLIDEYVVRYIANETIIMSEDGNDIHVLDEMGSYIWKLIDGTRSFEVILEQILNEYDVTEEVATNDLLNFIQELSAKKIIRIEAKL
jgi:hypothetical protein